MQHTLALIRSRFGDFSPFAEGSLRKLSAHPIRFETADSCTGEIVLMEDDQLPGSPVIRVAHGLNSGCVELWLLVSMDANGETLLTPYRMVDFAARRDEYFAALQGGQIIPVDLSQWSLLRRYAELLDSLIAGAISS